MTFALSSEPRFRLFLAVLLTAALCYADDLALLAPSASAL